VIVAVCSAKGAPGVTTLAAVLGMAWPGERLVLEADPSGGDLSVRLHAPGSAYLAREPTVLTLATAVRSGAGTAALTHFAQATTLGVAVIAGPTAAEAWAPMTRLWDPLAKRVRAWPGTVIADLGRLQPEHPGMALAAAADVLLVLTTASLEGLLRARQRAQDLQQAQGSPPGRGGVGVVVRAGRKDKAAMREFGQVMAPLVPMVGGFADDPGGVRMLLAGSDTAALHRSALMRSGTNLVERIRQAYPSSARPPAASAAPDPTVRLLRGPR
jgi:hypothetical protein